MEAKPRKGKRVTDSKFTQLLKKLGLKKVGNTMTQDRKRGDASREETDQEFNKRKADAFEKNETKAGFYKGTKYESSGMGRSAGDEFTMSDKQATHESRYGSPEKKMVSQDKTIARQGEKPKVKMRKKPPKGGRSEQTGKLSNISKKAQWK